MHSGSLKIYEYWCNQQVQDYKDMVSALDDVGAASLALANGGGAQAYSEFVRSRDRFRDTFMEMTKRYRYVEHN